MTRDSSSAYCRKAFVLLRLDLAQSSLTCQSHRNRRRRLEGSQSKETRDDDRWEGYGSIAQGVPEDEQAASEPQTGPRSRLRASRMVKQT